MARNYHMWLEIKLLCRFQGPPALCVCVRAACGAAATSENTHTLEFGSMYLVEFVICLRFQNPKALWVCVAPACGASATSEKTRPWIFGVCISRILSFVNGFRVQQMLRSVGGATRNKG